MLCSGILPNIYFALNQDAWTRSVEFSLPENGIQLVNIKYEVEFSKIKCLILNKFHCKLFFRMIFQENFPQKICFLGSLTMELIMLIVNS